MKPDEILDHARALPDDKARHALADELRQSAPRLFGLRWIQRVSALKIRRKCDFGTL
jgi:hypothetical protein